MLSPGSQHTACFFRDTYLKAVEARTLHAVIAAYMYTISIIYGSHLWFTELGVGWALQSSLPLQTTCA